MPDKVYTRTGDEGTTGLLYGGRVHKSHMRTGALGDADEVVSALGLARAEIGTDDPELSALVLRLQRELAVLNAELMTAPEHWRQLNDGVSLVPQAFVDALEREIDELTVRFEQPKDFIVPGNTRIGAHLDHAVRVARRAERSAWALREADAVRDEALRYLNRLADLLWVMARFAEREDAQPRHREGSG